MPVTLFRIAAALCLLAVGLGAFGAHALKATLQSSGMLDVWNKAVLYHFLHALALVFLALHGACQGCPSSTMTLKNGIEGLLKHYVPEVTAVEAV